jgi:hypothetical protein
VEDTSEISESQAFGRLNDYVDCLNNHILYDMGEYYNSDPIDYSKDPDPYRMLIDTISVQYCSDIENPQWNQLTITPYYDGYDYYDVKDGQNNVYCRIVGLNNESETELAYVLRVKIEEGEQTTSYEKFETDTTVGHGYHTINTYYSGLIVHRLTGEVWEANIPDTYKAYTGQSN